MWYSTYCGDFFLSVSRKDDPNKIGFIGGKIDDGEEPEQALLREVLEETGLYVTIDHLIHLLLKTVNISYTATQFIRWQSA